MVAIEDPGTYKDYLWEEPFEDRVLASALLDAARDEGREVVAIPSSHSAEDQARYRCQVEAFYAIHKTIGILTGMEKLEACAGPYLALFMERSNDGAGHQEGLRSPRLDRKKLLGLGGHQLATIIIELWGDLENWTLVSHDDASHFFGG